LSVRFDRAPWFVAVAACIVLFSQAGWASDSVWWGSGTVRARALAMGGAYHAVEDDLSAGLYNPGAFRVNATKEEGRFAFFFNPVTPAVALHDFSRYDIDWDRDDGLTVPETLLGLATVFKGAVMTTSVLDFGCVLWEEDCSRPDSVACSGKVFDTAGLVRTSFHSMFVNIKVAPSVSVGMTGTMYSSRFDEKSYFEGGYTVGVLLRPNPKLNVGIAYITKPKRFTDARFDLEGLENEAATAGIAYQPDSRTIVAIDLRTINKEEQSTSREIHLGMERRFGGRIALRGGYYRKKDISDDVVTVGVGLLPLWEKTNRFSGASHNDLLSYTLVIENDSQIERLHVVSLALRF